MWKSVPESIRNGFGNAVNTGMVLSGVKPTKKYPLPSSIAQWLGWSLGSMIGIMLGIFLAAIPILIALLVMGLVSQIF